MLNVGLGYPSPFYEFLQYPREIATQQLIEQYVARIARSESSEIYHVYPMTMSQEEVVRPMECPS